MTSEIRFDAPWVFTSTQVEQLARACGGLIEANFRKSTTVLQDSSERCPAHDCTSVKTLFSCEGGHVVKYRALTHLISNNN
jgi:hypothetical protein